VKIDKAVMAEVLTSRPALVDQLSRSLAEKRLADSVRDAASAETFEEHTMSRADQIKRRIAGFFNLVFHVGKASVETPVSG